MSTPRHYLRRLLIIYLIRQGLTTSEIAAHIGKSYKVVKWHLRIMEGRDEYGRI